MAGLNTFLSAVQTVKFGDEPPFFGPVIEVQKIAAAMTPVLPTNRRCDPYRTVLKFHLNNCITSFHFQSPFNVMAVSNQRRVLHLTALERWRVDYYIRQS